MDKKKFIKTHVGEFFKMSGIEEDNLNLNEVIDYLCSILNASTTNFNDIDYFEKPWISMKTRPDNYEETLNLNHVRKSHDNLIVTVRRDDND